MKSMFEVVKLKLEHLEKLSHEPANAHVKEWLSTGKAQLWVDSPESFSGFVRDELMICVGLTKYWEGRAHIWSLFSSQAEHHFVAVFRGMKHFMENTPYRRVEMDVPLESRWTELAIRRAIMLGFTLECPRAKKYRPNGGDSALYSWVKEGGRDV